MSSDNTGAGPVPAGWYGDPLARGRERYWDGHDWTDDVRASQPAPMPDLPLSPPPPAGPDFSTSAGLTAARPRVDQAPEPAPAPLKRENDPARHRLADPFRRFLAVTIDAVVCGVLSWVALLPLWLSMVRRLRDFELAHPTPSGVPDISQAQQVVSTTDEFWLLAASFLVSVIYETVLIRWRGATVGQLATSIRVVDAATGQRLGWVASMTRALAWSILAQWSFFPGIALLVAAFAFGLSSLGAVRGAQRQTWPDYAARSIVIDRLAPEVERHFPDRETGAAPGGPRLG